MAAQPGAIGVEADRLGVREAATPVVASGRRPPFVMWVRSTGWRHVVGIAGCIFALFPVVWIISASVNPTGTLSGQELIPEGATLRNYEALLFGNIPFLQWMWNTILIAGSAAIGTVFLCALAAFAFSRMRFKGRRAGLLSLLLVQMFPQLLAVVAIFLLLLNIGAVVPAIGLGRRAALILVYLGGALGVNTWLMKGFFDTIPTELDESAKVDGASHAQIFFRIVLPLAAPVLAVVGLISFVFTVNDFLIASVVLTSEDSYTLAVGLARFLGERFDARWGLFAAGAFMGGLPVVTLWLFLQRFVVQGLTSGAVKG